MRLCSTSREASLRSQAAGFGIVAATDSLHTPWYPTSRKPNPQEVGTR